MKKILLIALMTLFVVSCSGRGRSSSSSSSGLTPNTGDNGGDGNTNTVCVEHASLVNGACVCDSGYSFDTQGTCIAIIVGKVKLAKPTLIVTGNIYKFDDVKDINGVTLPSGVGHIHYVYVKRDSLFETPCETATYPHTLDCIDTHTLYTGPVTLPATVTGNFCGKAISCADGYDTSDIMYQQFIIQ